MNFIIVAIICIAVLIVFFFIFGGKAKILTETTKSTCTTVHDSSDECAPGEFLRMGRYVGSDENLNGEMVRCCKPIGE